MSIKDGSKIDMNRMESIYSTPGTFTEKKYRSGSRLSAEGIVEDVYVTVKASRLLIEVSEDGVTTVAGSEEDVKMAEVQGRSYDEKKLKESSGK